MDYLIGLDIGTTAIKGAIMSVEGKVLKTLSGGYNYYGEQNTKLLNPDEFLNTCFSVISISPYNFLKMSDTSIINLPDKEKIL